MITVSPKQTKNFIIRCMENDLVPLVLSSPGMGKSSIVREIAKEANLVLIDHRMSTSEPTDLTGLPTFQDIILKDGTKEKTSRMVPFTDIFPIKGMSVPEGYNGYLLFLDEFTAADKATQKACYKLILDRMVGQHELHEDVFIVLASNKTSDGAFTNALSTAMQSRVITFEMHNSLEGWVEDFAIPKKIDTRIISFLYNNPSLFNNFDPKKENISSFACQRTWEMLHKLIYEQEVKEEEIPLYSGTVGESAAIPFVQYTKVFEQIPKLEEVINDPINCLVPEKKDLRWAIISTLMSSLQEQTISQYTKYVERFPLDFRIIFLRFAYKSNPQLIANEDFKNSLIAFSKYIKDFE